MKKLFSLILCVCMAFMFSACRQDTSEADAKAVVNKYYTALSDGNWGKVQKYYTKDVDDGNDLKSITSSTKEIEDDIDDLDLNNDQEKSVRKAYRTFFQTAISEYCRSYEITKTSKNDDSTRVTVTVKVKGYNTNDFKNIDFYTIENELEEKYEARLYEENADIHQIVTDMINEMFDSIDDEVKKLDSHTHTEKVTLVKKGDGNDAAWKIKKITVSDSSASSETANT